MSEDLLDLYRSTGTVARGRGGLVSAPSTASGGHGDTIVTAEGTFFLPTRRWGRTYVPIVALIGAANALSPVAPAILDPLAGSGTTAALAQIVESRPLIEILEPQIRMVVGLLEQLARERGIGSSGVRVSTFTDPEEGGGEEVVVAQSVDLPAGRALDYWDEASQAIEQWTRTLPSDVADRVTRSLAVRIQWAGA